MRYVLVILGGLISLVGAVWLLQGIGILPGSFMTGQAFWAIMGAICLAAGGSLMLAGYRLNRLRQVRSDVTLRGVSSVTTGTGPG